MIYIELEDLIVNVLLQLNNYKGVRRVTGIMVRDCIFAIEKLVDDKKIKILDCKDCMKKSRIFDVRYSSDFEAEYILKDNVTVRDLNLYNLNVSNEIITIFESSLFLQSLGINTIEQISIDDILCQILKDTTAFYFQVGGKLNLEEYKYIKDMLQNKKCENCVKISCEIRHSTLVCDNWDNRELVGRSKILREFNINNLKK